MKFPSLKIALLAFAAGLLAFFAAAPFHLFPLTVVSLALLFLLWFRAGSPRAAAWLGFFFGLGIYGAGISFIYVALHDYGDMHPLLAAAVTLLAGAFLALFSALAGYAQARLPGPPWMRLALAMPATWALLEWLRGLAFTGFPCMLAGYSQVESPLGGYTPILGVYGTSLLTAVSAGLLALLYPPLRALLARSPAKPGGRTWIAALAFLAIWMLGALLRTVEWTQPLGEPVKVSLLQGNIPQELKFNADQLSSSLETYRRLALQSDARLIVLPETAFPILRQDVPDSLSAALRDHARANGGDVLIGAFERDHGLYYNSVYTLGTAESRSYRKNHLVPFGEFIPLRPALGWLINDVLNIPMGDLARGGERQEVLNVAGQKVAVDICYEDVFGEEIIRYLPEATLLVNVTNDAWYGNSAAAIQHNQVAQVRALESGRVMLRATNTGVTSVIDRNGRILHMLPQHEEATLTAMVQGYAGSTPYVRFGNALVLVLAAAMLAVCFWKRKHRPVEP
ncbi:MAG TPA: apolipoprotein N-acyltransferase [Gallionellaceae bacterium]